MDQKSVGNCPVQLLQTFGPHQELQVLLPHHLVLLELPAGPVVQVHDAPLDAIIVPKICLARAALRLGLLAFDLDSLELLFVAYRLKEVLDRRIFPLELILVVAPLFDDLFDLLAAEEGFLLVPEELIGHLLKNVLDFVGHFNRVDFFLFKI